MKQWSWDEAKLGMSMETKTGKESGNKTISVCTNLWPPDERCTGLLHHQLNHPPTREGLWMTLLENMML